MGRWPRALEPLPPPVSPSTIRSTVPTAAVWVPSAFIDPIRPQLPPAPPLVPRRHAPSLFGGSGAAPSPSPSGPLASPLTFWGVSGPKPRKPSSYSTPARSPGRRRAKTPGSLQVRGVNLGLSGSGNQNPRSLGEWHAAVRISWSSKWKMLGASTLESQMGLLGTQIPETSR